MKMGKITNKQVFMLVLALGALVCLLVYMLVFTKYNDQTAALKKSNAELQTQVDEMKGYYDNMEVYRKDSREMAEEITELTADYPADAREEDIIMMAVDIQNRVIVNFEKINVDETETIHSIAEDVVKGASIEGLDQPIDFMAKKATYSNETTYSNLKAAIATVYESPYRIGINAISYKKSSETDNIIDGTIDITYYSVSGMGKTYTAPEMPSYFGGASDLFGEMTFKQGAENTSGGEAVAE